MAKRDNKAHHDAGGGRLNNNRKEHANSFIMRSDPRLHQQQIAKQNLALNEEEGNEDYIQSQIQLNEAVEQYNENEKKHQD